MSYSILAAGTKDEVAARVTQVCDGNSSPEMPLVKEFLLTLCDNVEGDDKRILLDCQGYHSGGLVSHQINFKTAQTG